MGCFFWLIWIINEYAFQVPCQYVIKSHPASSTFQKHLISETCKYTPAEILKGNTISSQKKNDCFVFLLVIVITKREIIFYILPRHLCMLVWLTTHKENIGQPCRGQLIVSREARSSINSLGMYQW